LNLQRAQDILAGFAGKKIIVIGDVMLDEYVWGTANRISPEAPVIVIDADRQTHVPGGAANVVNNLCALGAIGSMFGIVGDDEAGRSLSKALNDEGAETVGLLVETRPTTRKTRFFAHSQQVVRVDHERREPIAASTAKRLLDLLAHSIESADAILISDYQKGLLASGVLEGAIDIAKNHHKPVSGNLKPSSFPGLCPATVITLNVHEASLALVGKQLVTDHDINDAGKAILERTKADHILITLGSKGLTLFSADSAEPYHIQPRLVEVYDTAGAGDTVISTFTLALSAGATAQEAAELANDAAAQVVKKVGVATVSTSEIANIVKGH
jgi:D-glycero-beta-D-manno-heptose-7-phosphate kinase